MGLRSMDGGSSSFRVLVGIWGIKFSIFLKVIGWYLMLIIFIFCCSKGFFFLKMFKINRIIK